MDSVMKHEEGWRSNENVYSDLEEEIQSAREFPSGPAFRSMNKHFAELCMKKGRILDGIYHQTESLGVSVRLKAAIRSRSRSATIKNDARNLNPLYLSFKGDYERTEGMLKRLQELPKEWSVIHISQSYIAKEKFMVLGQRSKNLTLWISLLPTGNSSTEPVTQRVTYSGQREDSMPTPLEELTRIIADNKNKPKQFYNNKKKYWDVRSAINNDMESVGQDIENLWLGKWRFLLLGELQDEEESSKIMKTMDKILLKYCSSTVSDRTRFLLYRLATATHLLPEEEVESLVFELLGGSGDVKVIAQKLRCSVLWYATDLLRKPVILVVDEVLDIVPWENLQIVADQPISRISSLAMLHALYKAHEDDVKRGYKRVDTESGYYLVNPQENLPAMAERFRTFIPKRLPSWEGTFGKCELDEFLRGMEEFDVFLYSGHGNGRDMFPKSSLEMAGVRAVSLLMGCSSTSASSSGGYTEYTSIADSYHFAASPLVIGNLWEVSDVDTDRITTALLHSWVPLGPKMTRDITKHMTICSKEVYTHERDLLRAVQLARKQAKNTMTRYAIIARGIPVTAVK